MKNLWTTIFVPDAEDTPQKILEEQCEYLSQQTNDMVTAKLTDYDGPISDYKRGLSLNFTKEEEVSIQKDLGDIADKFTFEFYITSPYALNYKYRVMFMQYGIPFYPIQIVLDEEIAHELGVPEKNTCESENEFEKTLEQILNSRKIEKIVNSLYSIAIKEEGKLPF